MRSGEVATAEDRADYLEMMEELAYYQDRAAYYRAMCWRLYHGEREDLGPTPAELERAHIELRGIYQNDQVARQRKAAAEAAAPIQLTVVRK